MYRLTSEVYMHTKWQMTFFLFSGIANAGILLCISAKMITGFGEKAERYSLAVFLTGFSAVLAVALGLNNPAGIISLLARPGAGLSIAVISLTASAVFGLVIFFRKPMGMHIAVLSAAVSALVMYSLFKLYMISTRPALHTYLLLILFIAVSVQFASVLTVTGSARSDGVFRKNSPAALSILCINAVLFAAFILRIKMLMPPDRILSFEQLTAGSLSSVFWGAVLSMFVIPSVLSFLPALRNQSAMNGVYRLSAVLGIFLLSILINQMPAMAGAAGGGRMLF